MTGRQKKHLRALAHALKPIVNLGKQGLSRETKREIESQLLDHELIKCKVLDSCPLSKKECAEEISTMTEIEVVQIIGKTLILFSPHPEDPKIKFTFVRSTFDDAKYSCLEVVKKSFFRLFLKGPI